MTILIAIVLWEAAVRIFHVHSYILPAPTRIAEALVNDFALISKHIRATLIEAGIGITVSVALALIISILMDNFRIVRKAVYPLLIISQTIPIMAVAPLMIIWFGFGYLPKIIIIILMCFFPISISLIDGFSQVDQDYQDLFRVIRASKLQVYRYLKFPNALPYFFSGLKIAVTYMVMAAVIAEWLGGNVGIGVYMLRSKQAFALDKVFAAVVLVVAASLVLIAIINFIARKTVHWSTNDRAA
jgi:ABC-type nitrate/sulfonate/bicarbonate transport system permease component